MRRKHILEFDPRAVILQWLGYHSRRYMFTNFDGSEMPSHTFTCESNGAVAGDSALEKVRSY